MKSRFLLILIAPIAAFIISCGPVDNLTDSNQNNQAAQILDQNSDQALNLNEQSNDNYWLRYYIPSAYNYYMSNPLFFPLLNCGFGYGWSYSLTNPSAPFYPWANYGWRV